MALRTYKNNGGLHICSDGNGGDRIIKPGQVFQEQDTVIAKLQPPGTPIKFELVDLQGEAVPQVVSPPTPASESEDDNRPVMEGMTIEELRQYATNNEINLGDAKLKKDIVNIILAALRE